MLRPIRSSTFCLSLILHLAVVSKVTTDCDTTVLAHRPPPPRPLRSAANFKLQTSKLYNERRNDGTTERRNEGTKERRDKQRHQTLRVAAPRPCGHWPLANEVVKTQFCRKQNCWRICPVRTSIQYAHSETTSWMLPTKAV